MRPVQAGVAPWPENMAVAVLMAAPGFAAHDHRSPDLIFTTSGMIGGRLRSPVLHDCPISEPAPVSGFASPETEPLD